MVNINKGLLMVSCAGICWATTGLFGTLLFREGLDPVSVASTRSALASILFLGFLLAAHPKKLIINPRQIFMLALGGLSGIAIFNVFYLNAINMAGMSTAVVLLYTSPVFAVILARIFLGEPLTRVKVAALIIAFTGVILVAEAFDLGNLINNPQAVLTGLGAGFFFSLLSVFGKYITGSTHRLSTSFYLLFTGSIFLALIRPPWLAVMEIRSAPSLLMALAALVLISTFSAHFLYIYGLSYLEAGKASIAVAIEPPAAIFLAYIFLGERLVPVQYAGVILVLAAVFLLRLPQKAESIRHRQS